MNFGITLRRGEWSPWFPSWFGASRAVAFKLGYAELVPVALDCGIVFFKTPDLSTTAYACSYVDHSGGRRLPGVHCGARRF